MKCLFRYKSVPRQIHMFTKDKHVYREVTMTKNKLIYSKRSLVPTLYHGSWLKIRASSRWHANLLELVLFYAEEACGMLCIYYI